MEETDTKPELPPHLQPGETHPADFLQSHLPSLKIPRGDRHNAVWDWAQSLHPEQPAQSRIEIWGRGGAKSTTAEQVCAYLACSLKRRLVLYVCGTQDQADLHVQAIAALLEKMGVPRAVNAYNASINWTAQRLQTSNGFGVIGVGLNSRIRGARLEEQRPDLIILDDVDNSDDTPETIAKKISKISKDVLPAGAPYATALFIQNKIHKDSVIARVADGRAEILLGSSVTEEPAVIGLKFESYFDQSSEQIQFRITGGTATWEEGQPLEVCERQINAWGPRAFKSEAQHESTPEGGLWDQERDIDPFRVMPDEVPELSRIVVGVDPSGSITTEAGIVAVGRTVKGQGYVLSDGSKATTPEGWAKIAIALYDLYLADTIAPEKNFGGDMVKTVIKKERADVAVKLVTASRGKQVRAEPVQQVYQKGLIHHVGHFLELEYEMCTWQPGMKSPNRLDALVWAITELGLTGAAFEIGGKSTGQRRTALDAFARPPQRRRFGSARR